MTKLDVVLRKTVKFLLEIENKRMAKMTAEEVVRLHGLPMDLLIAKPLEQCPECRLNSVVLFNAKYYRADSDQMHRMCNNCGWSSPWAVGTKPGSTAPPDDAMAPLVESAQLAVDHIVEVVDGQKRVSLTALTEGERMETHHYAIDEAMEHHKRG